MSQISPRACPEHGRRALNDNTVGHIALSFSVSVVDPRVGRGGAGAPNRPLRRALFERSELRSHLDSGWRRRDPMSRARAKMVLGTFAETKVSRRVGAKPHIIILAGAPKACADFCDPTTVSRFKAGCSNKGWKALKSFRRNSSSKN